MLSEKKTYQPNHAPVIKISRDKWIPLDGTFAPLAISAWTTALANVDRDKSRLSTKPTKEIHGYRFPEPGLIAYAEQRLDRYVINWLHLRAAVQHRVYLHIDSDPSQIPVGCSNEDWRAILNASYGELDFTIEDGQSNLSEISHHPPSSRRDAASSDNRRELIKGMFGVYPSDSPVTQVSWREQIIRSGQVALLNPVILQEIVWDLCEHNFRADLVALDRLLVPQAWTTDSMSRDRLLKSVFPGGDSYICTSIPATACGIASLDWRERRCFIGNLASLMVLWPGAPSELGEYRERTQTEVSFFRVERLITLFYCQTVFDRFGRPAILPYRIY